jgi:hypothetical protein
VHEHDLRTRGILDFCAVFDEEVPRVWRDDEARNGVRIGLVSLLGAGDRVLPEVAGGRTRDLQTAMLGSLDVIHADDEGLGTPQARYLLGLDWS